MSDEFQTTLRKIRRLIIGGVAGFVIVAGVVVGFVPIDEKVSATGTIVAEAETFLYAPDTGVLKTLAVTEGATVRAGDELLVVAAPDEENRRLELAAALREAEAVAALKKVQLERITKFPLPKEFWHARAELAEAEETVRHAIVERQRYQELFATKLASEVDFDQRRLKEQLALTAREKARANVAVLDQGLAQDILTEAAAELTAATAKLERLKTDLAICENQIDQRRLRAPSAGRVTLLLKRRPGEAVVKGEELIHLASGEPNQARLFVGETMFHRVRVGQQVRLRSHAFDALRYGYVTARVEHVALEPSRDVPGRYLVKARIEKTPLPLVLGSTVEGDIILRRLPIWRLLLPARGEL
ncbi:MAG: hypothetical protein PCFJNLEI_00311 [Verrucomicrobiae bacterium]|nr:hypothetical protein [Verrucomicrobiae bacterium]